MHVGEGVSGKPTFQSEVYSNTGGQQSKATPLGASAKFASAGKGTPKKDIGMMAMSYGHVYVARVAFGAKDTQTVKAFQEAESWNGPSLIIGSMTLLEVEVLRAGGMLPLLATAIVAYTGNIYAGLYYPIAVALMTVVIGLLFLKDTKDRDITI